ncbi:hypothetical protein TruAng_008654 [Truncatella angustata]|nr:hypothetical protein TruAng_008654 [Truncatella angustata]
MFRPSAAAPPVAPPRAQENTKRLDGRSPGKSSSHKSSRETRKHSGHGSRSEPHEGYQTKGWEDAHNTWNAPGVLSVSADRTPAFERIGAPSPSQPLQKPVEPRPALKPRGLHRDSSAGSPPPADRPQVPNVKQGLSAAYKRKLPMAGQRHAATSPSGPRPPRPAYEVYLDAQRETERAYALRQYKPIPRAPHIPVHASVHTRELLNQAGTRKIWKRVAGDMGFGFGLHNPGETDSEVSFACGAAREIERGIPGARR